VRVAHHLVFFSGGRIARHLVFFSGVRVAYHLVLKLNDEQHVLH
jgi:acetyl-CoA acetyltransferase